MSNNIDDVLLFKQEKSNPSAIPINETIILKLEVGGWLKLPVRMKSSFLPCAGNAEELQRFLVQLCES